MNYKIKLALLFLLAFAMAGLIYHNANAATGINEQINYQARLLDDTGAVVPDGNYHLRFKIYQDGNGVLGGGDETLKWTETRTTGNLVTVKNGYFSVSLGSVTAFGTSVDWNQDTLWLSIEVGGTGGSPTWDGEMDPFRRLAAAIYALNSKQLGGLDWSKFVQIAPAAVQADTSTLSTLFLNKTGASGNILQLQKNGTDKFVIDNTGIVTLASLGTADTSTTICQNSSNQLATCTGGGGGGNSFETINAPAGTDPVADSGTDTLNLTTTGTNLTLTGTAGTDTLDFDVVESVLAGNGLDANGDALDIGLSGSTLEIVSDDLRVNEDATFAWLGAHTFSSAIAANGGITFDSAADNVGAHTLSGTLDANTNILTNIGNTGTDFVASTGALTLAGVLTANGGATITGTTNINTSGSAATTIGNASSGILTGIGSAITFRPAADAALAFDITNAAGTTQLFIVDSSNSRIYIGDNTADGTGALLVLDTKNTSGDPTGVNGGMYYNSNSNKFRCYENTAWKDCDTTGGGGGSTYVVTTANVASTASTAYQNITGLSWSLAASTRYDIECRLRYDTSATTIGLGVGWTGPALPTFTHGQMVAGLTTATVGGTNSVGNDTGAVTTSSVGSANDNIATFQGFWSNGVVSGTLQMRFKPETATAGGVTILTGSWCKYITY